MVRDITENPLSERNDLFVGELSDLAMTGMRLTFCAGRRINSMSMVERL